MTITMTTCPTHPGTVTPCSQCASTAPFAHERRETPLGTIPAMRVGEPTFASDASPNAARIKGEWVAAKNLDIREDELRPADNNVRLWWSCANSLHDDFQATLRQRHGGENCPECMNRPRAAFIVRIVSALVSSDLSNVSALAILAHHGVEPDGPFSSGSRIAGLMSVLDDEGLTPEQVAERDDAFATDPEAFVEAAMSTGDLREAILAATGTEAEAEPETDEQRAARGVEVLEEMVAKAEATGDALAEGEILAGLVGDDLDMTERLVREIEADLWDAAGLDATVARASATTMLAKGGRQAEAATTFLRMLDEAESLAIPGLNHRQPDGSVTDLTLAQRRSVVTLAERGALLNCMTVGGGKTLAAIASAMHAGAGNVVVVCPSGNVQEQWAKEVVNAYGSAGVEIHNTLAARFLDPRPNWSIVSVDTFSLDHNEADIVAFAAEVGADLLIVDEVHKAKQRNGSREQDEATVSARSRRLRDFRAALGERNPRLRVLGMTGTPVLNDLREPLSLLELVLGKDLGIEPKETKHNVALVSLELRRHSVITLPSDSIEVSDPLLGLPEGSTMAAMTGPGFVEVNLTDHLAELIEMAEEKRFTNLNVESLTLADKAEAFADHVVLALSEDRMLDPSAVVVAYTRHVDAVNFERIVSTYARAVRDRGLTVRTFTANEHIPDAELSRETLGCDVVIGTQPMGTGVNGLQNHARRIVILSAPWTYADWQQVIGRLGRTGQRHEVLVNPVVGWFDMPSGKRLSLEAFDLARVLRKKALADAVMYGVLPTTAIPDPSDVLTALVDWQTEVSAMVTTLLDPEDWATVPASWWEIVESMYRRGRFPSGSPAGEMGKFHRRWFHESTQNRWDRANREREVRAYNVALTVARATWAVDPADNIADHLRGRGGVIVDAGSGTKDPRIAVALGSSAMVRSYDMASEDPRVQVADVTALPEPDSSARYFVLCQAIMGTNAEDYLREANRVLDHEGVLHFAETAKHFGEDLDAGVEAFEAHLASLGFTVFGNDRIGNDPEFVVIRAIKTGPPAPVALPWSWSHIG